jgi:hypothetical protein
MPTNLHTHDLILRLKKIQAEQNLTPQKIEEMLDAAGYHVSLNSIRKVFSDGSEDLHFRFHDTLQPISRVLLGIYGDDKGDSEVDALHAAIRVKDELIEKLEREILEMRTESHRKNDFLMKQIALKDERIDKLMARVDVLIKQIEALVAKLP